ncbi:uncharacterized protein [Palaemon carinicauda]|uniref:uncharacterized protein n=1 Tax=Palaemon carinicauda TaxID=392227 RepID=UPI0035B650AF
MKLIALLLLVCVAVSVAIDCESSEIACTNSEKCIPHRYICDTGADCSDESDEDYDLCNAWKNHECETGSRTVECTRNGETKCMSIPQFCSREDPPCDGPLDRRVCLMLANGTINKLSNFTLPPEVRDNHKKSNQLAAKFNSLLNDTISHPNCPSMYTLVGDQCISLFYVGSMSWGESRAFCKVLGGDLLTFTNVSQYAHIVQHLQRHELSSDFWIGGSFNNTSGWTWLDASPMELGSPYWATRYSPNCLSRNVTTAKSETRCYRYYQVPEEVPKGECVSLSFEHSFHMTDEDCLVKKSPLCIYEGLDLPKPPKF